MQEDREVIERLAAAVIKSAVVDLQSCRPAVRASARQFLEGESLDDWCSVCGLHPELIRQWATHPPSPRLPPPEEDPDEDPDARESDP